MWFPRLFHSSQSSRPTTPYIYSAYADNETAVESSSSPYITSMSSGSTSSARTSSASLSRPPKSPILSSGRGGAGNKRPKSVLKLDLGDEAEILQKRRQEASLNPRVKVKYTGRGGTGNIRAASMAQSIPFDISADPDDDYEQIVLESAQKAKKDKVPSTGRGGLGNLNRPRSKSVIATNVAAKGKKEKTRRRRSTSWSRYTNGTAEHFELRRITTETAGLSLDITASRLAPPSPSSSMGPSPRSAMSHSSLPTPPSSSPSALYMLLNKASTTTSLPNPSTRMSRSSHSSSVCPSLSIPTSTRSTPTSPIQPDPHTLPFLQTTGFTKNPLARPTSQSTVSLSSRSEGASTSTLGLLSPPASPVTSKVAVAESNRGSTHKLQKPRNQDSPSKWWKMGGRRRVKESIVPSADPAPEENRASTPEEPPIVLSVPLQRASSEAMAHLQEVGMHAMEVRLRMREERLSIIRNGQRYSPPPAQELEDDILEDDEVESDRNDLSTLPSVPEEDVEYFSFFDFN